MALQKSVIVFFILVLISKNINWCKCLKSALSADFFNFNFLIIENRFSKAGYHSIKTTKNGETKLLSSEKLIRFTPQKKLTKYAPPSPEVSFPIKLKIKIIINEEIIIYKSILDKLKFMLGPLIKKIIPVINK